MYIQEIIVGVVLIAAALYLFKFFKKTVTDHNCSDCSLADSVKDKDISK